MKNSQKTKSIFDTWNDFHQDYDIVFEENNVLTSKIKYNLEPENDLAENSKVFEREIVRRNIVKENSEKIDIIKEHNFAVSSQDKFIPDTKKTIFKEDKNVLKNNINFSLKPENDSVEGWKVFGSEIDDIFNDLYCDAFEKVSKTSLENCQKIYQNSLISLQKENFHSQNVVTSSQNFENRAVISEDIPTHTKLLPVKTEKLPSQNKNFASQTEKLPQKTEMLYQQIENLSSQKNNSLPQSHNLSPQTGNLPLETEKPCLQIENLLSDTENLSSKTKKSSSKSDNLSSETLQIENSSWQTEKLPLKTERLPLKTKKISSQTEKLYLQTEKTSSKTDILSSQSEKLFLEPENLFLQTENSSPQTKNLSSQTENLSSQTENLSLETENLFFETEDTSDEEDESIYFATVTLTQKSEPVSTQLLGSISKNRAQRGNVKRRLPTRQKNKSQAAQANQNLIESTQKHHDSIEVSFLDNPNNSFKIDETEQTSTLHRPNKQDTSIESSCYGNTENSIKIGKNGMTQADNFTLNDFKIQPKLGKNQVGLQNKNLFENDQKHDDSIKDSSNATLEILVKNVKVDKMPQTPKTPKRFRVSKIPQSLQTPRTPTLMRPSNFLKLNELNKTKLHR